MRRALLALMVLAAGGGGAYWWAIRGPSGARSFTHGDGWHGVVYRPAGDAAQPLVLVMDPGGYAGIALKRHQLAADTHGVTLVSTKDIYNGTDTVVDEAILDSLIETVSAQSAIDRERIYLSGFSGAGVQAYYSALRHPDTYRGAIVEGAHTGGLRMMASEALSGAVYVFCRTEDFNSQPSRALAEGLEARGVTVKFAQASGGHEPMTPEQLVRAVAWMLD